VRLSVLKKFYALDLLFFVSPYIIATAAHNIRKISTSVGMIQLDKQLLLLM